MRKILIIGTGGTIACIRTPDGLTPAIETKELKKYIPGIDNICIADTHDLMSLDSTNIGPEHWLIIKEEIKNNYDKYDGFVICHGTDTMAYTAAALSYLIQNSSKPIVITGAQKPINVDNTDARTNLFDSCLYAADPDSHDVNIVFDGKVICGTRAKKSRAKSYNAFSSINYPYIAVIQDEKIIRYINTDVDKQGVLFYDKMKDSVCVLKLIPGLHPEIISYMFSKYQCLVIESFGVGGIPERLLDTFYKEMEAPENRGKFVVMTTQVANEGSNMTVYQVGRRIKKDFHIPEAYDMTLEATITKLMWITGEGCDTYEELKERFYHKINNDILFR